MKDALHLRLILDAIQAIRTYTQGGKAAFLAEPMLQDGVLWRLATVGEAVKELAPETKERAPEVPWRRIAGMRDRLIHGYASVDLEIVWQVVAEELGSLEGAIRRLLPETEPTF